MSERGRWLPCYDKKRVLAPAVCSHVANTTLPPLDKYILQFRQIHLQFEKIHFTILRNTFFNLDKYILLDKKRVLAPGVCSHVANTTLPPLGKYLLQFGKIHMRILTNILLDIDKYILVALLR